MPDFNSLVEKIIQDDAFKNINIDTLELDNAKEWYAACFQEEKQAREKYIEDKGHSWDYHGHDYLMALEKAEKELKEAYSKSILLGLKHILKDPEMVKAIQESE